MDEASIVNHVNDRKPRETEDLDIKEEDNVGS